MNYGREHEKDARAAFSEQEVKKHRKGKLLESGLLASLSFPLIKVSPANTFHCKCCEDGAKSHVEYKFAYNMRDKNDLMHMLNLTTLRKEKPSLLRTDKYYSQVICQTALLGAKHGYYVVWTPVGSSFIVKNPIDAELWSELERNAVVFIVACC